MRPFFRTPFGALRFIWNMGRVISAVDANEFEVGAVLYDSEANMVGSFVSMNRNLIENLVKKAQPFIDYRGDDPIMAPNKIAIQGTARYSRALCCPGGHTDEGYREAIGKLYAIIKKPWK